MPRERRRSHTETGQWIMLVMTSGVSTGGGVLRVLGPSRGSKRGPAFLQSGLLVTSVSVSGYHSILVNVFGLSVALIQSLYWGSHNLLGPHQYMGPQSVCGDLSRYDVALSRYLGPRAKYLYRYSIYGALGQVLGPSVKLWSPQHDITLSRCGTLGVQTDNGFMEHSLACGAHCESAGPLT